MRIGLGLVILGALALALRACLGSHIAEDGTLVEPFFLEASGKIAMLLGGVLAGIGAVVRMIKRR